MLTDAAICSTMYLLQKLTNHVSLMKRVVALIDETLSIVLQVVLSAKSTPISLSQFKESFSQW